MKKPKRQRKYNPHKIAQKTQEDRLKNTFFYHGSMIDCKEPLCGNLKYQLTCKEAAAMLRKPHTWSGVAMVFCIDDTDTPYIRRGYFSESRHVTREEMDARIQEEQLKLLDAANSRHTCSAGFFIMPDHTLDLSINQETITQIFEAESCYDYTVTALASQLRLAATEAA